MEYIKPMLDLLERLKQEPDKGYDIQKIGRAYEYAAALHDGQFRASGEPYICHPVAVATIVADLELDTDSICAALLHDTVEDCSDKTNLDTLRSMFGDDVAEIVDGLTKIRHLDVADKEEAHIENIRKMLLAMARDLRVIFIKLCDRLHNMRTLQAKADDRRRAIALETMRVYAPLAHRLGMNRIKQELEALSLQYLDPIGYHEIETEIERKYGQNRSLLEQAQTKIEEQLNQNHIKHTMYGRVKSVYSMYRKMYDQNKSFDDIYDFYALRIIVGTELECYTVLGIVHELFRLVPNRFKDYISMPKANMYRSLHTTVMGPDGIPFEVQIRTEEMHRVAEYGLAAHWKYKLGGGVPAATDEKLRWIARLIENDESTRDPDEFIHSFKTDIFNDETFVFTPKGDVICLPNGATVIDFAYAIHTAVGNRMVGAKVNGAIVPIDRRLQTGEIVEILTSSSSKGPSRDWLKIVTTSEARNKIRQYFKREMRTENIALGRAEIDREFRRIGRCTEEERNTILQNVAARYNIPDIEDFYNTIGYGGLSVSNVAVRLHDEFERVVQKPEEEATPELRPIEQKPRALRHNGGIVIDGVEGCAVKFAKCCAPLPGDRVVAFVTKGYGVSVHKIDCPNAAAGMSDSAQASRWLNARWEQDDGQALYEAALRLHVNDRIGMMADISSALADMRVSITRIDGQLSDGNGGAYILISVACRNTEHYQSIVSRLRSIRGVESVERRGQ